MISLLNTVSIRARLAFLTVGGLLVFAVGSGYAVRTSLLTLERTHGERMAEIADVMLNQMGAIVAARMDRLAQIGEHPTLRAVLDASNGQAGAPLPSGTRTAADDTVRRLFIETSQRLSGRNLFDSVVVLNRQGTVVAATDPLFPVAQPQKTAWWRTARNAGRHVGDVATDPRTGAHGLSVALRLDDQDGRMIGMATAMLSATWVTREAAAVTRLRGKGRILLTTRDGRVIFSSRPFRFLEDISARPFFRAATDPRGFMTLDEGGRARLYAYAVNGNAPAIGALDWVLFLIADRDQVLADTHALQTRMLILFTGVLALAVLLAALLSLSLLRPLAELRAAAQAMASGTLSVRVTPRGRDELADLGAAFNLMVEKLKLSHENLQHQAATDALTGVANRRGVMTRANADWDRCRRYGHTMTVLALDIDHFKAVNDTHGHDAGDAVLRHVANLCGSRVRKSDFLGRTGGEEFVTLLPETAQEAALILAERLRAEVADTPCETEAGTIRVTISIGVATITDEDGSFEALLRRADAALYRAKKNGRDRIETAA